MTLRPSQSGVLWVASGSLWATTDGPHRGAGNHRGDQVFRAGERVEVAAGERMVIEPVGADARFAWDPAAPWPARRRSVPALLWRAALLLPAAAATAAMWLGAAAESDRHRADLVSPVFAVHPVPARSVAGPPAALVSRRPA